MDLTDINPTIISTDTEDEEHVDGASRKKKKRLSYKNPVVRLRSSNHTLQSRR